MNGPRTTKFNADDVKSNFEYTDEQITVLQNQHRAKMKLEEDTLQLLQEMTAKAKLRAASRPTLVPEDLKVMSIVAEMNMRYIRLTNDRDLELKKIEMKEAQNNGATLNPADMGPREREAFIKMLIAQDPEKVKSLLP